MHYGGEPGNPPAGRASVPGPPPQAGRASVPGPLPQAGRASVPPPPAEPPTGRASVGGPGGGPVRAAAPVTGPVTGSASVPTSGAAFGSASARASVPSSARMAPPSAAVPDAPEGRPSPGARAKKRRRRNILIAALAAFIMVTGIGMVAGTYYFDQVELPENLALEQSTSIYYADGPLMARIGRNRTLVKFEDIPKHVQQAVVAAEDNTFYTNDGVDYWGVARAAWNNVTGGELQGASTISQQYARKWATLEGVTYGRKVREAIIATKLNQQYTKDQIMTMYLNIIYFGRGADGIQAAAYAYFNKPVKELTVAEGMVIAGIIKNPNGDKEKGSPFDPTVNQAEAQGRFDYIRKQMVALKFIPETEAQQLKLPTPITQAQNRANNATANTGLNNPEGLAVHHVLQEVAALTDPATGGLLYEDVDPQGAKNFDRIRNGGLKIVSTLDSRIQKVAVQEASTQSKDSNMFNQRDNLQAALVAVEPGTGAVKAYYGGDKGSGNDYAGYYMDPVLGDGKPSCCGGHPPGSTFKVYTLATALMAGYTIGSYWNGVPHDMGSRTAANKNQVKNATEGTIPHCKSGSGTWCTLEEITVDSLNVPFFEIAMMLGPDKVIDTARAAGLTGMWATVKVDGKFEAQRQDLLKLKGTDVGGKLFDNEVGFGQYPITVLDHAGGMATFAARGMAAKTHFLKEVWQGDNRVFAEVLKPQRIAGFTEQMADDLTTVLQGVPAHYGLKAAHGYQLAGKTGTWQLGTGTDNAHAWMAGYVPYDKSKNSPGLAAAVWVGNKDKEMPIKFKNGENIIGGKLPGPVWRDFLDGALTAVKMPKVSFLPSKGVGDKDVGTGISPTPSAPVDPANPTPNPNPNPSPSGSGPSKSPKPSASPSASKKN
ncbi:transglycosylase domain-containing protein [Dactylosporangium sp. NPDC050588]|uniref:transglycosylase domain-containing protein n=1 Tax=Dactylosporangium sp. NPDC050588 TaxID=3157211 RepID=UPI0034106067